MPPSLTDVEDLRAVPASDVKKHGWRGLMRRLGHDSAVVVTNHAEPEGVVMTVTEYQGFLALAEQVKTRDVAELDRLRHKFDERLAALRTPGTGDRLRRIARRPARLHGKVKAGTGF